MKYFISLMVWYWIKGAVLLNNCCLYHLSLYWFIVCFISNREWGWGVRGETRFKIGWAKSKCDKEIAIQSQTHIEFWCLWHLPSTLINQTIIKWQHWSYWRNKFSLLYLRLKNIDNYFLKGKTLGLGEKNCVRRIDRQNQSRSIIFLVIVHTGTLAF